MGDQQDTLATRFNVDWPSVMMANWVDQDESSIIQRFQQMSPEEIEDRLSHEETARELAHALVKLVRVTGSVSAVGLSCALSALVLAGNRKRVNLFAASGGSLPVQEYVRVLSANGSESVQIDAAHVIGQFISAGTVEQLVDFSFEPLLAWLVDSIAIGTSVEPRNLLGLRAAALLFRSREFRLRFIASAGMDHICSYITRDNNGVSAEVLYRAAFCVWTLSYHDEAVPALCRNNVTTFIVKKNLPHMDDKISRLSLSTLVNLLNKTDEDQGVSLNDVMVESAVSKYLLDLSVRKWTAKDQKDVEDDIGRLNKVLGSKFLAMNTFERYMAELTTGSLKEGQMHTAKFWSQNSSKFEHKEFLAIRLLVDLLDSSDSTSVVLACRDLGEFARFYDGGKKIIQHYKGKVKIMGLMASSDAEIQKAALLSSAKLLITNWEHV